MDVLLDKIEGVLDTLEVSIILTWHHTIGLAWPISFWPSQLSFLKRVTSLSLESKSDSYLNDETSKQFLFLLFSANIVSR